MVPQTKFYKLKNDFEDLKRKNEKIKYFSEIPNMDSYKNIKGYEIGNQLGLNEPDFLKTLNVINHFVTKTGNTLKD